MENNFLLELSRGGITPPGMRWTDSFINSCNYLYGTSGVYLFSIDNKIVYIGVSLNLAKRIPSSFCNKFDKKFDNIYLQYIKTNRTDCYILESYLIGKIKPELNKHGVFSDALTLKMKIPDFSEKIKCAEHIY